MKRTACFIAIVSLIVLVATGCKPAASSAKNEVVVYCAQDHVYAEPILAEFTRQTGIRVRSVYDSEAVKTVGLANRLIAERSHPQCDVFWGNEELRTRQLAAMEVFRPTNGWAAMGYRSRRIVINTNLLDMSRVPRSLLELTNAEWRGRVVLAYPLFGSSATHFLALRQHWGPEKWEAWCRALAANRPLVVDGNSVSAKMVARGEAWIGLTDSDDILVEKRRGAPLSVLPLTAESLLLPNTVGVVRGAPHPDTAQKLFEFLQTRAALAPLVEAGALEGVDVPPEIAAAGTLQPDWSRILADIETATARMREIFLR
jgi:iron(III) transport system substrate-binding protein